MSTHQVLFPTAFGIVDWKATIHWFPVREHSSSVGTVTRASRLSILAKASLPLGLMPTDMEANFSFKRGRTEVRDLETEDCPSLGPVLG